MKKEIKEILVEALDIGRWAPKTNTTYSFLDDDERQEMADNILKELKDKGYKIIKE